MVQSKITVREVSPYETPPPPPRGQRRGGCGVISLVILLGMALAALVCTGVVLFFPNPDNPPTPTVRFVPSSTLTPSKTVTNTPTETATATETATSTPSVTFTPSITPTATLTASDTPSNTPTWTFTPTDTPTHTATPTDTFTPTNTPTDTPTSTFTPSNTPTSTLTYTPTFTLTSTATATSTSTYTPTFTFTPTPTPLTRTITLMVASVTTDNIQEDAIWSDGKDEIRLIYEIQEVDPNGELVDDTEVENIYTDEGVQAGETLNNFDSLTLTIPSSHSVRVRIRLIEDDVTVVGGFVVNESSNVFSPIIEVVISADTILASGGLLTWSTILTDDEFLRTALYEIEYMVIVSQ